MAKSTCSVDTCASLASSRGWCSSHWNKWRRYGDPLAGRQQLDHKDGTRTCSKCEVRQPYSEFYKDARNGMTAKCGTCNRIASKQYLEDNREANRLAGRARYYADLEQTRQDERDRYQRDRAVRLERSAEQRHRRREVMAGGTGLVRGITATTLRPIHGDRCHYCDVTMLFEKSERRMFVPDKATVEHIIPLSKGGTHDWPNVTLACWQCNVRKGAKRPSEWSGLNAA